MCSRAEPWGGELCWLRGDRQANQGREEHQQGVHRVPQTEVSPYNFRNPSMWKTLKNEGFSTKMYTRPPFNFKWWTGTFRVRGFWTIMFEFARILEVLVMPRSPPEVEDSLCGVSVYCRRNILCVVSVCEVPHQSASTQRNLGLTSCIIQIPPILTSRFLLTSEIDNALTLY